MNADIAVVIPCYNRENLVLTTLDAICQQSLLPQHLIIVDDYSNDNTTNIINDWIKRQDVSFKITFVRQRENKGVSIARNVGLEIAVANNYEFIYFLDSDDQPGPYFIEKAVNKLNKDKKLVAATADRKMIYNDRIIVVYHFPIKYNPWKWFLVTGAGIASCTVFRTEAIDHLGGFSAILRTGQDVDLFIRVAHQGKWEYIPNCPVTMNARSDSKHIKDYYDDYLMQWAMIFEFSFTIFDIRKYFSEKDYRKQLEYRWLIASIQAFKNKEFKRAYQCYLRSLVWSLPGNTKKNIYMVASQIRHKLSELLIRKSHTIDTNPVAKR